MEEQYYIQNQDLCKADSNIHPTYTGHETDRKGGVLYMSKDKSKANIKRLIALLNDALWRLRVEGDLTI